jgi:hypothetical protein
MNSYILKADNRRPLKFSGELLGNTHPKSLDFEVSDILDNVGHTQSPWMRLALYRTAGGKVVLHSERFGYSSDPTGALEVKSELDTFECIKDYIDSAEKKNGVFGVLTVKLLTNCIENYPELAEYWVDTSD